MKRQIFILFLSFILFESFAQYDRNTLCNSPVITQQPLSQTICYGDYAIFSQTATGDAPIHYQWRHNGIDMVADTFQNILILSVEYPDTGQYTCFLSNACGDTLSDIATLSIYPPPIEATIYQLGNSLVSNSTSGNQWYLSDIPISGAIYQTYVPTISGSYSLSVTSPDGCSYHSDSIYVFVSDITEIEASKIYSIFPNPTNDKLTIESLQKSIIEITNIQGQKIIQQQIQQGKTDIDISGLEKGLYILRLNSNDKIVMTKFLKE